MGKGAQPPIARGGPGFVGGAVAGPRSGGHVIFLRSQLPFHRLFLPEVGTRRHGSVYTLSGGI